MHQSASGGAAPSATSAARTSISASLPSLLARTLPANAVAAAGHANRRRPPAATSGQTPGIDRRLVSTECQTEEDRPTSASSVAVVSVVASDPAGLCELIETSEPPRRRRREKRRHHRRSQQNVQPLQQHVQQVLHDQTQVEPPHPPHSPNGSDHLPDILNAHMPPPYSTLPHNSERCMGMGPIPFTALPVPLPVVPVPLGPAGGLAGPAGAPAAAPLLAGNSFSLPPAGGRR